MNIQLDFVERLSIRDPAAGLTEPSGLALSANGDAFWTVSDDTKSIFKLGLDGQLLLGDSFAVDQTELEGIALDNTGSFLYAVQEQGNRLLKISTATGKTVGKYRVSEMLGYERVAKRFAHPGKNKGLEGVTVDGRGRLYLLKEDYPGLLLAIAPSLQEIVAVRRLTRKKGFFSDRCKPKKIDFSGLTYDSDRDAFWIVSDRARCVFLYSWALDEVIYRSALTYASKGKTRRIKKAEGVAFSAERQRLYIVSDQQARLYIYEIRTSPES